MTIRVKNGGVWTEVYGMRPRGLPNWVVPKNIRVKGPAGTWSNTGFVSPVARATGLHMSSASTGGTGFAVTWVNGSNVPLPTSYIVNLYRSNGTLLRSLTVPFKTSITTRQFPNPAAGYTVTFGDLPPSPDVPNPPSTALAITPDTNYYVTVTAKLAGARDGVAPQLKIRTGHDEVIRLDPIGGWGTTEDHVRPTGVAATSSMSGHGPTLAVDVPNASDEVSAWSTAWVSGARNQAFGSAKPHPYWEGVSFSLPDQPRLLTRIDVVANDTQDFYLGLRTSSGWRGSLTAANLGIAATGYPEAHYDDRLVHNYVSGITTNQVIRDFNVESQGLTFADLTEFNLAITRLVPLYPTAGTSGSSTSTTTVNNPKPLGARLALWGSQTVRVADANGNWVTNPLTIAYNRGGQWNILPSSFWKVECYSSICYILNVLGQRVEYTATGQDVWFTLDSLFPPGSYGTNTQSTTTTTGTPAVTNYRGHIQDVVCFYKPWVSNAGGYSHILVTPRVQTVSGPSAW